MIVRKALLVGAFTVWSRSVQIKLMFTILVLILSIYMHNIYRPMASNEIGHMEGVTLLANALVLTVALTLLTGQHQPGASIIVYMFWLFISFCFAVMVWVVWFVVHVNYDAVTGKRKRTEYLSSHDVTLLSPTTTQYSAIP